MRKHDKMYLYTAEKVQFHSQWSRWHCVDVAVVQQALYTIIFRE